MIEVDIYPVGLLHDLRRLWMLYRGPRSEWNRARPQLKRISERLRSGNRSYLNGYLAEPRQGMGVTWTRCGHGWTPKRALQDLDRHMAKVEA